MCVFVIIIILFCRYSDWQKFRDEQVILLNWLAQKEKILRDMEDTDITDEKQVQGHLDQLEVGLACHILGFLSCIW